MDANTFWTKFKLEYILDSADIFGELSTIEGYKQAALNLILPPDWSSQLDRLNRVRAVYGTTALEGNPLSEAEVSHQLELIDRESTKNVNVGLTKEQMQIRNSAKAQDWVRQRFKPGSTSVSLDDILTMHRMITEKSDENHNVPGQLRTYSVRVGSPETGGVHVGAPSERLPELMEEFIGFLHSRKIQSNHPVIVALLAHFFLVTIHPFGDGNGRLSRLLEAGILFQGDYNVHGFYGLSNYFYNNETEYKTLLQECRIRQPFDVSAFIKFGVIGFAKELSGINNFIKTKINRVVYRQMLVKNFNTRISARRRLLNEREYQLLDFLLTETEPLDPFSEDPSRKISFNELLEAQYVKIAYKNVTTRTFFRELTRLADLGFIQLHNESPRHSIVELDFNAISKY